jgi:hypothetical protein
MIYKKASASFTRPADTTAYAANDLVANSTTAGSVVPIKLPMGKGGFAIHMIQLTKTDETDVANADFDVNFYATVNAPVSAAGDNAAWSIASVPVSGYLGEWDLPTMTAASDEAQTILRTGDTGMLSPIVGYNPGSYLYAFLQADGAYSPASAEVFTLTVYYESSKE